MKRFLLLLLTGLAALTCAALAEGDWTLHESVLDYTILYPADLLDVYGVPEEEGGWNTDVFEPKFPGSGAQLTLAQVMDPDWPDWDAAGYRRLAVDEPNVELDVGMDMMYRAYVRNDGTAYAEEIRLQSPTDPMEYVFTLVFPADDPDGWQDVFEAMLETAAFPRLGAQPGSLTLRRDFTGGLTFTDVVVDPAAEPFWLYPEAGVIGLAVEKLTWDGDMVAAAEPVYTAERFTGGECLRIFCYGTDVYPALRVRCTGADGWEECWYIAESGRDGSLMLLSEMDLFD